VNVPHYVLSNRVYESDVGFLSAPRRKEITYRTSHLVSIDADESAHLVEVHVSKPRLLDHLRIEPTPKFRHQQQHVIVRSAWKKDLSCIQLVKRAAY
jgi:hypothetical protein